ncbi:MAG: hypothetical protein ABR559_07930 [Gemmatimonadota bacterium]
MNAGRVRRFGIVTARVALIVLASCRPAPSTEEDDLGGCCAFDSTIDIAVMDGDSLPVAGVRVELAQVDGGPSWADSTDATGHVRFAPGILATFLVTVTPPAGYALAAGSSDADTVAVSQVELSAARLVRLQRAP